MSSLSASVQEFVAMQPKFAWRRRFLRGLINVVFNIIFRMEITGLENVPAEGSSLLMMNHITLLDPILS